MTDVDERNALLDAYVAQRKTAGAGVRSVAKALGVERNAVRSFEQRRPPNPHISTLVAYGEVLGLRLVLELHDLELSSSAAVRALEAGGYPGSAMLQRLVEGRKTLRVTQRMLAAAAADGWTWSAVADLERHDREPRLKTLQRYARGLGGRLEMRWEALP